MCDCTYHKHTPQRYMRQLKLNRQLCYHHFLKIIVLVCLYVLDARNVLHFSLGHNRKKYYRNAKKSIKLVDREGLFNTFYPKNKSHFLIKSLRKFRAFKASWTGSKRCFWGYALIKSYELRQSDFLLFSFARCVIYVY